MRWILEYGTVDHAHLQRQCEKHLQPIELLVRGESMEPAPSTRPLRSPVTRWLARTMRPSFLVSMCNRPAGASCS